MVRKLKVYDADTYGYIYAPIRTALGLPNHVQQAKVLIASTSKNAAVELAATVSGAVSVPCPSMLCMAMGNAVDALAAAGLFEQPCIVVYAGVGHPSNRKVVSPQPNGDVLVLGRLLPGPNYGFVFEPTSESTSDLTL